MQSINTRYEYLGFGKIQIMPSPLFGHFLSGLSLDPLILLVLSYFQLALTY